MKRASYRDAVDYIAMNDEPCLMKVPDVIGMISIQLVAQIFDVPAHKVAQDVVKLREIEDRK